MTNFASRHSGGRKVLLNLAGGDATKQFREAHSYINVSHVLRESVVGRLL